MSPNAGVPFALFQKGLSDLPTKIDPFNFLVTTFLTVESNEKEGSEASPLAAPQCTCGGHQCWVLALSEDGLCKHCLVANYALPR